MLHAFDVNNLVFLDPTNPDTLMAKVVAPKWVYDAMQADWSVAFSPDGATVYAMNQTQLIAINPSDLSTNTTDLTDTRLHAGTKWSVSILNDRETLPVVDAAGTIYIADNQSIVAINPVTAAKRTVITIPGKQVLKIANNGATLLATIVPVSFDVDGNRIFDENGDSELYEINPVAGSKVWSTALAGSGEYANPIIDSTGAVYTATVQKADGVDYMANVYMFDNSNPRKAVFTYSVGTIYGNDLRCPILGMDGTLYAIIDGALVAFGGTADLSPALVATPSPVYTNGALSFTTTVTNAGPDKSVASSVKITLPTGYSTSSTFVLPGNCAMAGSRVVNCALGEIAPGGSVPVTLTGKAQATVGTESITATVKSDTPDPNTTNNSKTISVSVIAPPPPVTCDLTVTAVSGPTSVTRGTTSYNFTATVKNSGTGSCAASTLGFYFSSNTTIDATDTLIGTKAINTLAAGASQSVTLSTAVATSKIAASTTGYYVGAFADYNVKVAETSETNNTKATTARTVVK
jgi:hypothetical protein